ncbi:MAG: hypothetical protein FWH48_12255, partial [Oscillospiraceae bacterium]|nr:hypothetical protein [Oscillospiraceae bacterium]
KEGKGVEFAGSGTLTLTARGWSYNGELSGEAVNLFFPLESVPALPFDPNDDFQIYAEGKFYMFGPKEDARACAKMATIGECAYWKFGPGQMTPGHDSGFAEN